MAKQALDLINRQQAEITEKDESIQAQADCIFTLERALKEKTAEIERLNGLLEKNEKAFNKMTELYNKAFNRYKTAKSEAIKEFWKRFDKVLCENIGPSKRVYWKISSDGDNLVKDMTEVSE